MAYAGSRRFHNSQLNAGAPPWGVDAEPEGEASGPPGQAPAASAPTASLPTSIYPFGEDDKDADNSDVSNYQKYDNRRITSRQTFKSNLSTLVEESTPDDGPAVAPLTNIAAPTAALTPRATSTAPSVPPIPTSGPFAQTSIGTPESIATNTYNHGANQTYAQTSWPGPMGGFSFQDSPLGSGNTMPNFDQQEHDSNSPQQVPPSTAPWPGLPPAKGSYTSSYSSPWPIPDPIFSSQSFRNSYGSSVGSQMKELSLDGAPPNDISINPPATDSPTTNPRIHNRRPLAGTFSNEQHTTWGSGGEQLLLPLAKNQQATNESILGELRMNYVLDPISMVDKGFLPTLDENNFPEWAINMERYLKGEGLWPDWDNAKKYEGCPHPELHIRAGGGRYPCKRPECIRRDRIDAAGLLVMVMSCSKNNRSLILRQNAIETAWLFLERAHVCGIREISPDFRLLHPKAVMTNTKAAPVDDHKISDFMMTAYRQWSFYLWLVENHGTKAALPQEFVSEDCFLETIFLCFPDYPPYKPVKDLWLSKIQQGGHDFVSAYGFALALERSEMDFFRKCFGMKWLPGQR
ncbi:hypothetical protein TWF225_009890 [Orbilia oligospora]|nr:hypothetical protein TWF225_009890 [Orbilia oligospora]KAF3267512.1 hypothetical protein TWF128_009056 [Orbilia oligospora]KAF3269263.1 hypothetical protein TWF217_009354 [Orbilia oligospora]